MPIGYAYRHAGSKESSNPPYNRKPGRSKSSYRANLGRESDEDHRIRAHDGWSLPRKLYQLDCEYKRAILRSGRSPIMKGKRFTEEQIA
ncbi:MAG: hypothetical protein ACI906_000749, partial [Candidatus Latescibacterota bacterium]